MWVNHRCGITVDVINCHTNLLNICVVFTTVSRKELIDKNLLIYIADSILNTTTNITCWKQTSKHFLLRSFALILILSFKFQTLGIKHEDDCLGEEILYLADTLQLQDSDLRMSFEILEDCEEWQHKRKNNGDHISAIREVCKKCNCICCSEGIKRNERKKLWWWW